MEYFIAVVAIVIIALIYTWSTYNKITKQKLKVKQAKSGIDVYLQQRFDLIPNLVECVKKYCEYEQSTLNRIADLRAIYNQNKDLKTGEELNNKFNQLLAVAEDYPDLKADEQFLNLQKNLSKMESLLQAARRLYNIEVTSLNTKIMSFPSNIIANMFHFEKENLFEIEDVNARKNINVEM